MLAKCWILLLGLYAILAFEGFMDSEPINEEKEKFWSLATEEYNKASDDTVWWIPVDLLHIDATDHKEIFYSIKLAMSPSNCTKTPFKGYANNKICTVKKATNLKACTFYMFPKIQGTSENIKLDRCSNYVLSEPVNEKNSAARLDLLNVLNERINVLKLVFGAINWMEYKTLIAWKGFLNFMIIFKKEYSSLIEQLVRFKIYLHNMRFAQKLQNDEKGSAIYGVTQFSDLTPEEFQKIMLPSLWWENVKSKSIELDFNLNDYNLSLNNLPEKFDWRTKGVVTPIKNQGSCGSCWAFSVTGNIEGLWAIKTGKLISLSEQELIDCDVVDKGCNGGLPINAFREIKRMGGLEPEDQYPYRGVNGTCHLSRKEIAVTIDDAVEIPRNETVMAAWVAQRGPLSVGVDAELLAFYRSGILHPPKSRCPPSRINHGVLIIGYGTEYGRPYWIIKNSWGERWGENGYFRLMRGRDVCGVSDLVSSAIIY